MQVSVEKTSELNRKMSVSVPKDAIEEKVASNLKSLARNAKIDGFRPGKAPAHVISKLYGKRVRGEVIGELIQSSYEDAMREQQLRPVSYPQVHSIEESDTGFSYIAEFEVYPEIELTGLEQLAIERPQAEIGASDFDNMLNKLREQHKTWDTVERAAAKGDRITLNFSGTVEGENFTNGKVSDFQVEIGAGKMVPGFEDNLIDLKAGDQKTFEVQFPADYNSEKLADKLATFEIEVVSVEEAVLPELNAEFVEVFGVTSGDVEEFKNDVKANMERELKRALSEKLKDAVMESLYSNITFEVPNALINDEIDRMMKPFHEDAKKRGLKTNEANIPREFFTESAKRRVALGLILAKIIDKAAIKVAPAKIREAIEDIARTYEDPDQVVNWYYADKQRLGEIEQFVMEDQTVTWIVEQAQVRDVAISFEEAMNRNNSPAAAQEA